MAIGPGTPAAPAGSVEDRTLFYLSLSLFFIWGFATVLIDILIPKMRALFELSFAEAMLTQFAFFLGYFVFSIPAGRLVSRVGYMRGIVIGLLVMIAGCLLFVPAARVAVYAAFLVALFVMAAGITTLQVAANAVISIVGPAATASSRLTLAQAFNSFGTFIGPIIGAQLILGGDHSGGGGDASSVVLPYVGIAAVLAVIAIVFHRRRDMLPPALSGRGDPDAAAGPAFHLLGNRRVSFAVIAIFAYVGAEVSIGSILVTYLAQPSVLALSEARAGAFISLYWGGAMVGRFIGSAILARVSAGLVLAAAAATAIILAALSGLSTGMVAGVSILAIGLFNSVMFPTIFSQGVLGLGADTPKAAALLCMGIVGGAILPLLTGVVADAGGQSLALLVPIAGYAWVLFFGVMVHRGADGVAIA